MSYVYKEYADSILAEVRRSLLLSLDRPLDFLKSLDDDSDWAFVIKAQTLIEAAVTEAIASALNEPRLLFVMERLPLADDQIGKLALAKELGLLEPQHRRYIRKVAALRNRLAHRVDDANFEFASYVSSLNSAQRKDWHESVCWFCRDPRSRNEWIKISEKAPRTALWLATLLLVAKIGVANAEREAERSLEKATYKTAERLLTE